jgi:hypothetical protein
MLLRGGRAEAFFVFFSFSLLYLISPAEAFLCVTRKIKGPRSEKYKTYTLALSERDVDYC